MRWLWTWILGSVTVVLAVAWTLPRLLPDLDLGLDELNQLAGIASLAVAVATGAVTVWAVRHPPAADDRATPAHGGGATTPAAGGGTGPVREHIDFSGGTFHGPVTGKKVEYHRDRPDAPG
ncbi:hypothetical protein [Nocardiopsis sp. NRRL B-16309]|uniref:hypothetical protein n=1 Tax=Nocardiopsis sp. NRRL B-16309 TaxID=1519494 RepID=UPI0006AEDBF0|nr:hypothetical protein [Nocardiopsis sp. NRRL B-16309]KOX16298.1 hypothetical protein ADL05_12440 [Nocardiopsis sp. NRRL B-16309]